MTFQETLHEIFILIVNKKSSSVWNDGTHVCKYTVRAAKDLGYYITLIGDVCATKDLEWNGRKLPASFINDVCVVSLKGKFAEVMTCADYFSVKFRLLNKI